MNKMQVLTAIVTMLIAATASAKTDVQGAIQQLKTNEENAKANLSQYTENAEIASKNIVEVTSAIKKLREQRTALQGNANNLEKNRAILDKMKQKLVDFSKDETVQMKKEEVQILQLRSALEKLEANKVKRQQNLETYKLKISEVEKEKASWDQQKEALAAIQKEIDSKEQKAAAEREKWIEKRKGYRAEAGKWEKESQIASDQRVKFTKLKD